jgi:hypothetical protein
LREILLRETRRKHLLTGIYLSGLTLATTALALGGTQDFHFPLDPIVSIVLIGLFPGIIFAVASRLERTLVPILMFPFAVLATVASALHHRVNYPGQLIECGVYRVNIGFPLPWNFRYELYGNSPCPLPAFPLPPQPNMISFFLDVVFYVAAGIAIIQLLRGTIGRTNTTRSSPVNKMI